MNVPQNDMNLPFDKFKETEAAQDFDPYIKAFFLREVNLNGSVNGSSAAMEYVQHNQKKYASWRMVARNCLFAVGISVFLLVVFFNR